MLKRILIGIALILAYQNCSPGFQSAVGPSAVGLESRTPASTYSWTLDTWGECSVTCGGGNQVRTLKCVNAIGDPVTEALCGVRPSTTQSCNTAVCTGSVTCASGFHVDGGTCISDTRTCAVTNGTGTQLYNGTTWGSCTPASCSVNYVVQAGACVLSNTGVLPENRSVTSFYPGDLQQVYVTTQTSGQTGQWWCENQFNTNMGGSWSCAEVGGSGGCNRDAPSGSLVTCVRRAATQAVTASVGPVAGQTGQWWCDKGLGANTGAPWQCLAVDGSNGGCFTNVNQNSVISCAKMYQADQITVAAGPVSGQTGDWWCEANFSSNAGGKWRCLDQSGVGVNGAASCTLNSNAGSVVRCERVYFGTANGNKMRPDSTCARADIDGAEKDFCRYTTYTNRRDTDSLYLVNRYLRMGINKRLGGTIFELYGPDFENRIEEHGGSAMQLSLWGYDAAATGAAYFRTQVCDATPYTNTDGGASCKAANNGVACKYFTGTGWQISNCTTAKPCADWSAAGPINPIQAQAQNCGWDDDSPAVAYNQMSIPNQASPGITLAKQNPYNFTKTTGVDGMTWGENAWLPPNAPYAAVDYYVNYQGASLGFHNQEMPAIFLDTSLLGVIYFYEGASPYADAGGAVSKIANPNAAPATLGLPGRTGDMPAQTTPHPMTEDWASYCDSTGNRCVTLATFNPLAKEFCTQGQYITVLGRFALRQGFVAGWKVYLFPYRFDDVVEGKTVRQWIYDLKTIGG